MKKSKKGDSVHQSGWHPDFRNPASLPDVKVVRTVFFIRGALILALVAILGIAGYREYDIRIFHDEVKTWEASIEGNRAQNREAIRLNTEFAQEVKKIEEISAFLDIPFLPSTFLRRMGEELPEEMVLSSVRYREEEGTVTVRGRVLPYGNGAPSPGQFDRVTEYRIRLENHPYFGSFSREIVIEEVFRNEANVEFVLIMLAGDEEATGTP